MWATLLAFVAFAAPALAAESDPREIVRRSVSRDESHWARLKDFTFEERVEIRRLDGKGVVNGREAKTYDVVILEGSPYKRLIRKDDQPLSPEEAAKEQKKFDRELAARLRESPREREKRMRDFEKQRGQNREFAREVPEAYNFRLVGEESIQNHQVWVIDAEPKPGYEPRAKRADILKKVRGRIWIDQEDFQWVKAEAEVIDTVSFGLFLVRVQRGARFVFAQRQEKGMWVPSLIQVAGTARLGMVKNFHLEQEIRYGNYRRFLSDSQMIPGGEVEGQNQ